MAKKRKNIPVSKDKAFKNYTTKELFKLIGFWFLGAVILGVLYYLIVEVLGQGQLPDYIVEPIVFLMISALLFVIGMIGFKDLQDKDMM